MCLFVIKKKWSTENTFLSKYNMVWFPEKCFFFWKKTLYRNCEKFRNVVLFADYIKFGPQTFDCYIYIYIEFFFSISSIRIWFYINFGLYFYNCYLFFSYYFLIKIFYLSNLILILLIVTYFIWNNLWNGNYYYFNFFVFQFFYFLDFISIILIIIYFIWDNLWNYFFFNFILIQLFHL
jgi:hypothetical protein